MSAKPSGRKLLVTAVAALIAGGVTACKPTLIVSRYRPLHPENGVSVELGAKASDRDGVSKMELFVYEYELYVSASNMRSARQRPGGTWGLVRAWSYPANPTTVDEKHQVTGFPAGSFIKFLVQVHDSKGNVATDSWSFAAGDSPFGNSPIPIWSNGAPGQRIDIAFVADRDDYANGRAMLGDLESLIFDGYHTNNGVNAGKKYWQFYYSPDTGHISDFSAGAPYVLDIPNSVTSSTIIDHAAVIHTTIKRDWASGGNFGTEPGNRGTAVHESGHSALDLGDEYDGGGHFSSSSPHHNIYNSKAACEDYNRSQGYATTDCETIGTSGWWRSEPATAACIMLDDGDAAMPDFEHTCIKRVNWVYGELEGTP